jgi:hypothetical protein
LAGLPYVFSVAFLEVASTERRRGTLASAAAATVRSVSCKLQNRQRTAATERMEFHRYRAWHLRQRHLAHF